MSGLRKCAIPRREGRRLPCIALAMKGPRRPRVPGKRITFALIAGVMLMVSCLHANNVAVSNVSLGTPGDGTVQVVFDITWENSWRMAVNHDACWVFLKYCTVANTNWQHATLNGSGTNPAGYGKGSVTNIDLVVPGDGKGCFIQRSSNGSGSLSSTNVQVVWDVAADGVSQTNTAMLRLFAVEMVFVPEGGYELGSGGDEVGHFYRYTDGSQTTLTYTVSSEDAITTSTDNGNLWGTGGVGGSESVSPADPDDIPAAFSKGYDTFYCMKYEISQRQYCDFLNMLTATQQGNRSDDALLYKTDYRNFIKRTSSSPSFFGCDANDNAGGTTDATASLLNESDDGEWVACNYVSWMDGCAYADWAGLRPMTELEFEKACRGSGVPGVPNEYAWGNTTIKPTTSLSNDETSSEIPDQGNCNYYCSVPRCPYRCGCYAAAATTRQEAGASYYGILDFSGSLWEKAVTVGNATGRLFDGLHGDGSLSANGHADVANWPGLAAGEVTGASGSGWRGGGYSYGSGYARVSDRTDGAAANTARQSSWGFRAVRSAP